MAAMEDEELRRKLKEFGEDVVVTDSTRTFLASRLRRLSHQPSPSIANSGRRSLLNFSSDESESDSSRASAGRGGISSAILGATNVTERRSKRTSRSSSSAKSPNWNDDNFVQPRNPLRRSVNSNVDGRSSRSTTSSGGAMTPTRHHQQQRSSQAFNLTSTSTTPTQIRPSPIRKSKRGSSLEKTIDTSGSDSDVSDSSITNIPENRGVDEFPSSRRSIVTTTVTPSNSRETRKVSGGRRDEISGCDYTVNETLPPLINGHHGLLEEEPISTVDLNSSSFASTASESSLKNNSQCISMILVIILAFFFLVVGLIYLRYRDQVPYDALGTRTEISCNSLDGSTCSTSSEQVPSPTEIALQLMSMLQTMRGEAECDPTKSARMTVEDARVKVVNFAKGVSVALNDVFTIFDRNKSWGIKFLDFNGEETDATNPSIIWWLESKVANMPWSCRFSKAWQSTVHKLTLGLSFVLVISAITTAIYYLKEREKQRKQDIYNMVEKILETLQNNYTAENNLEPYTPIPHVRDRLIPPAERAGKRKIWDEAVKYIQEYESRVRQEVRMIKGEDIAVWHWLPADTSPAVGRSRSGRLWQGQAFENTDTGVNALPYSPSPCLKVRNMFDPEIEIEDNWTDHIRDEILEKCTGSDIVHIRVDESLQGCVYIKCKDAYTAGQVFKRLHGSWFDGKLVTVKYLRLERYHERFPDAIECTKPIQPSTEIGLTNHNSASSG
ncbi:hypothetical protein CHUAL_002925 [Chamberlinius hualienensis]